MSHIFDALQRTAVEQSGIEYPDLVSVVTKVFEVSPTTVPVRQQSKVCEETKVAVSSGVTNLPPDNETENKSNSEPFAEFPSLVVNATSSSRLVFLTEPEGLAAEKFRFLGVRLRQLQKTRTLKKVLVTSTIPEEGKSLVSANLAGVLARRQEKVLLIDGDLRRPVLAEEFGVSRLAGIAEWLQGDRRKLSNIYCLKELGFWFMPAGNVPSNPLELMSSVVLGQMMERASELFDWIIVDSPPLLPLADTSVWMKVSDGILLVSRIGKTEKSHLQRGLELVKKSELIGVVLNGCDHAGHDYYQRYAPLGSK
jgi:capsular exopolysaccharide synthesis family protein